MAQLATDLLRTVTRAFYPTDHTLVIDALITHSTLPDTDLAHLLSLQPKALRKLCGRLKEDGLLSVQTRAEKRTDGSGGYYPSYASAAGGQMGKERLTNKDWYYLNYHRAIDSIKFRMWRLNKHFSSLGLPATEKKDLSCPQCKSQWTELEVVNRIDFTTGQFLCARCNHPLDPVEEEERVNENESVKRLNSQLEKILRLMQQIDATSVPENDFQSALAKQKPVVRSDANPGQRHTEVVDLPNRNLQSSKGLEIKPEKISVSLQNDEDVRKASAEAEERERREKEARQNALPDWISRSTVTGDVTTVGAKEEALRKEREAHIGSGGVGKEADEEKKPALSGAGGDVDLAAYWAELETAQKQEAAERAADEEEEEDEDDEEDEFEDVGLGSAAPAANGASATTNGTVGNGVAGNGAPPPAPSTGISTPALESSNATDDEREAKRPRLDITSPASTAAPSIVQPIGENKTNGIVMEKAAADTPAASDEDEDELEFENV